MNRGFICRQPLVEGASTTDVGDDGATSTATLQIMKCRELHDHKGPCSLRILGRSGVTRSNRTNVTPQALGCHTCRRGPARCDQASVAAAIRVALCWVSMYSRIVLILPSATSKKTP